MTRAKIVIIEAKWKPNPLKKRGGFRKALRVGIKLKPYVMLKKIKTIIALFALVAMMSSCALTLPVNATSNEVGSRVGTAKATGYFSVLFFDQDASIRKAAQNGGIKKISTVDIKYTSILGLVVTYETIVTGE